MTLDEKHGRDWREVAEDLTKAIETEEILELAEELEQAMDEADEDKKQPTD
jgi:hypothetical protein